jgi:folate-binding protein YgfZ
MAQSSVHAAFLTGRGVVKVTGGDSRGFLDGLVTAALGAIAPGTARFAALLTPQGKITADFLITEAPPGQGGGFLLDCPAALAPFLTQRLAFYKLRAKVTVEDLSDQFGVMAVWGGVPPVSIDLAFADPRHPKLGWRILVPHGLRDQTAERIGVRLVEPEHYDAHRIACGVPQGGADFAYGDTFPHEANMDRLAGVDFDKGCYVGQEVVSRMEHRGTARTRIVRVLIDGPRPEAGADIVAGGKSIGSMGSARGREGLALIRLDRAADALAAGEAMSAGGVTLRLAEPVAPG